MTRKLASIQRIAEIIPIEGADSICSYRVNNWNVVDSIAKYELGELVVYCETDSWIPNDIAPFLSKGKEPREFNGIKGEKLRSVRLRKTLSQGLLLKVPEDTVKGAGHLVQEGLDVTEHLGIQLWEAPIPACLAGQVRGNFPAGIPKTEATRIQNLKQDQWEDLKTHEVEITEKIHGSSLSLVLDKDGDFHVCSRNLDLKPDENNSFWKIAYKHDVERLMKLYDLEGLAIQGELIGEGINGNQYKVGLEFVVFNVYNTHKHEYMSEKDRLNICSMLGLKHVPVIYKGKIDSETSVQEMLKQAEGKSLLNGSNREGFVIKSQKDTSIIVKVISNAWLLKNEE